LELPLDVYLFDAWDLHAPPPLGGIFQNPTLAAAGSVKAPRSTHNTAIWSQVPLAPEPHCTEEACWQFGNLFRKSEDCSFLSYGFQSIGFA
jgi:hypothetical protein